MDPAIWNRLRVIQFNTVWIDIDEPSEISA